MKTIQIVQTGLMRFLRAVILGGIIVAMASSVAGSGVAAEQPAVGVRCSVPRDEDERDRCAAFEQQILDATILLDFAVRCSDHVVPRVPSHPTIVDERILLTHDHFDAFADPGCVVAALEMASARGDRHWAIRDADWLAHLAGQLRPGPIEQSGQARLLSFPDAIFTPAAGLRFARYADLPGADALTAWGEVADVNWRWLPGTTRVQWVRPLSVERRGAALGLVVDGAVEVGASGGGAFRVTPAGLVHVGNIWGTWREDDTSIVALNR